MPAIYVPEGEDWIDTYQRRKVARLIRRILGRPGPWLLYGGTVGAFAGGVVWWLIFWAG